MLMTLAVTDAARGQQHLRWVLKQLARAAVRRGYTGFLGTQVQGGQQRDCTFREGASDLRHGHLALLDGPESGDLGCCCGECGIGCVRASLFAPDVA